MLILVSLLLIVVGVTGAYVFFFNDVADPSNNQSTTNPSQPEANRTHIRLIATGDMIPHDAINERALKANGTYDYYQFMENMKPYFDEADIRFCNQAVLGGGPAHGITGYPVFNSPTEFAGDMHKLGCNLINTGTNHTNDKTQAAINDTVASWDGLPGVLAVAGANRSEEERQKIRVFEQHGVRFAFLSYTTYTNSAGKTPYGLTMFSEDLAAKQLKLAEEQADLTIVSMRWGTEYSQRVNTQQTTQAKFLAANGADIVLGHGPHVLEPVQRLAGANGGETIIWYSLGNFLNAQLEAEALINGIAVMDISIETKKIDKVGYLPIYMHYEWTDAEKAREDLLARKNFSMYLLEDAAEPISMSQLDTTIEAQKQRLQAILNKFTTVPLLTKGTY